MLEAPVNVYNIPDEEWDTVEQEIWRQLNTEVRGHPGFYPLTIKGGYVMGSVFLIVKNIAWLFRHPGGLGVTYIPIYVLTATIIELLGRCREGETRSHKPTLKQGLKWFFDRNDDSAIVITTSYGGYSIADLEDMRNFSAHGQATSSGGSSLKFHEPDRDLLDELLKVKLGARLDDFWGKLITDREYAKNLAKAKIDPINSKRVLEAWKEFDRLPYRSIEQVIKDILM